MGIIAGCIKQVSQTKIPSESPTAKAKKKVNEFETAWHLKNWKIVKQDNPKVSELHIGSSPQYRNKFKVYFDTLQPLPNTEEAIEITKTVLNFKKYNDIKGKETKNGFEGHWYHKNIKVIQHYAKYKHLYKDDDDLSTKYGSYMYVHIDTTVNFDTTNIITKQEAIAIAKEKSSPYKIHTTMKKSQKHKIDFNNLLPYKIDSTLICWDDVDNVDCFPKIEAMMALSSYQNITRVTSCFWVFDLLTSEEDPDFSFASSVDRFTGKFTQGTPSSHAATTCNGCYTCNGDLTDLTDPTCDNNDDSISSFTDQPILPLPGETDLTVPTRWNNCITFPEIVNVSLNDEPFRFFAFPYDDFTITVLNECNANSSGFCTINETFMIKKDNSSFNCEELCAYNAVNSLASIQNLISSVFVDRGVFTNKTDYFDLVGRLTQINVDFSSTTDKMLDNTFYNRVIDHIALGTALNLPNADFSYTDLEIIGHEYAHHLTENFWKIKPSDFPQSQFDSDAIFEALADIYSHFFTEKIKGVDNWLFADAVVNDPNSPFPRDLSDPAESALPQAKFYDPDWGFPNGVVPNSLTTDGRARYYKAGILSFWFYILTKGKADETGTTSLDTSIGLDAAEALLFDCLKEQAVGVTDARILNFQEFRDIMLSCVGAKYNDIMDTEPNLCSVEYSRVFRAFEAVGLIDNSASSEPNLKVTPPCNVKSFEDVFDIECPTGLNFTPVPFDGTWAIQTTLGNSSASTSGPFYVEVLSDDNNDCVFNDTELHPYLSGEVSNLNGLQLNIIGIPTRDTKIKIIITDISSLPSGTLASSDYSLPSTQIIFTINEGCNVSTPEFSDCVLISDTPTANEGGVVNLSTSGNVTQCLAFGQEVCIDYSAYGSTYLFVNAVANGLSFDNIETMPQSCTGGNCSVEGQFCFTPTASQTGTNAITITASDNHPTQPIFSSAVVNYTLVDFVTDVWQISNPVATNESSAGANDGSIDMRLGSIHNLEYHYSGPNGFSLVTQNNPINNLSDGSYTIDVYVAGTMCWYNAFTVTIGTNSSGGPVCAFDQDLMLLRAVPTIFNDQTVIEIELQEKPLQLNLAAFDMQGNPIQNLVNGQVLQVGTHQIPFDGSAEPNGLYIFSLAASVPQCRSGEQAGKSIKGFKY